MEKRMRGRVKQYEYDMETQRRELEELNNMNVTRKPLGHTEKRIKQLVTCFMMCEASNLIKNIRTQ